MLRCFSGGISSLPVPCPAGFAAGFSGALLRWPSHCKQQFRGDGHGVDWVSRISRRTLYLWLEAPSSTTPSVKPWRRLRWTNASRAPCPDQMGACRTRPASALGWRPEAGRKAAPLLGLEGTPRHAAMDRSGFKQGKSRGPVVHEFRGPSGGPPQAGAMPHQARPLQRSGAGRGVNCPRQKSPAAPCGSEFVATTAQDWPPRPCG